MATALRPIGHDDRLSLVDHLDELRHRLIICTVALLAAFAVCFWQQELVLEIVNRPVEAAQRADDDRTDSDPLEQAAANAVFQRRAYQRTARALELLRAGDVSPAARRALTEAARANRDAARRTSTSTARKPVTLGVAEPFTSTITVALYAAILLTLPLLLYQLYAFVLPAFTPVERRTALPLMLMVPVLFVGGVTFGYFIVLQRAVTFLQNFNDDSFDILLRANEYYRFAVIFLAAIGLLFQIPVAVLAVTRLGILTTRQLRRNRGYVLLAVAVLAAVATPTPDPITMLLAMGPLVILFELSILVAAWIDRVRPVDLGDDDDLEALAGDDQDLEDEDDDLEDDDDDDRDVNH